MPLWPRVSRLCSDESYPAHASALGVVGRLRRRHRLRWTGPGIGIAAKISGPGGVGTDPGQRGGALLGSRNVLCESNRTLPDDMAKGAQRVVRHRGDDRGAAGVKNLAAPDARHRR